MSLLVESLISKDYSMDYEGIKSAVCSLNFVRLKPCYLIFLFVLKKLI